MLWNEWMNVRWKGILGHFVVSLNSSSAALNLWASLFPDKHLYTQPPAALPSASVHLETLRTNRTYTPFIWWCITTASHFYTTFEWTLTDSRRLPQHLLSVFQIHGPHVSIKVTGRIRRRVHPWTFNQRQRHSSLVCTSRYFLQKRTFIIGNTPPSRLADVIRYFQEVSLVKQLIQGPGKQNKIKLIILQDCLITKILLDTYLNEALKILKLKWQHSDWGCVPHIPVVENEEAFHYQHKHPVVVCWCNVLWVQVSLPQERRRISLPRVDVAHHHIHVESIEHLHRTQRPWFILPNEKSVCSLCCSVFLYLPFIYPHNHLNQTNNVKLLSCHDHFISVFT